MLGEPIAKDTANIVTVSGSLRIGSLVTLVGQYPLPRDTADKWWDPMGPSLYWEQNIGGLTYTQLPHNEYKECTGWCLEVVRMF